ncbi:MAG TPA: hypothetical protein VL049_20015 [Candidatus Dormibacteraeota bacterium]|nr:hypothetical protein [Candidatus Dormibacteraeota bacterium]
MPRTLRVWIAVAALLTALAAPVGLATAPAAAQLPTPVLESGAAGDGTGAAPLPGISYPIVIALVLLGGGIGVFTVTIIRRWDRDHYPDSQMKSDPRDPHPHR